MPKSRRDKGEERKRKDAAVQPDTKADLAKGAEEVHQLADSVERRMLRMGETVRRLRKVADTLAAQPGPVRPSLKGDQECSSEESTQDTGETDAQCDPTDPDGSDCRSRRLGQGDEEE